jgi:hypothetical protein
MQKFFFHPRIFLINSYFCGIEKLSLKKFAGVTEIITTFALI